jgi:Xaa-Pro aminopeptidase
MKLIPTFELNNWSVDALIIENPVDLKYLCSLNLSQGLLIVDDKQSCLFVDGRYIEEAKGARLISEDNLKSFLSTCTFKKVGFDEEALSFSRYSYLKNIFQAYNIELVALKSPIKKLRSIKTLDEIKKLKEAAELNKKGFKFVQNILKEGVSEREVSNALKIFWIENGGDEPSFEPIIAFGKNSSKPHYRSGNQTLKKNDIALIDIGVSKDGWQSDATKTYIFGQVDPIITQIYKIVEDALEKTLVLCKEGLIIKALDEKARGIIKEWGYEKDFKHSIGHGLGLEVHEYPLLKPSSINPHEVLKEGMCITIEPGIYLEGIGGIRLEKSIVITKNGYELLC